MVRVLLGVVERAGGSRDRFLAAAGIDARSIEDGDVRLPLDAYVRCVEAAVATTGDPAFGLHLGEQARPTMFDVVGSLTSHAQTLGQCIESMIRYSRIMADGFDPELHEAGDRAALRFPALHGDSTLIRMTAEFAISSFVPLLQLFAGRDAPPPNISFAYRAPAYVSEYRRLLGSSVRFEQPSTEVEFPRAWLERPQLYPSPDLYAVLQAEAERRVGRLERGVAVSERLELLLATGAPRAVTMEEAAGELSMSERTLRRRLAQEGVTYGQVVERGQIHVAKRMLEDKQRSIQETAHAMGFATAASFHRAFMRWTGMTPKQYRDSF